MKLIPLSQGKFAQVDDEDYDFLMQWKWFVNHGRAVRSAWTPGREKKLQIFMHRVLMDAPPGMEVDHRNMDPLDNQRHNLRVCTPGQNQYNKRARKDSPSGLKNITPNFGKRGITWAVKMRASKKEHYIGTFKTLEAAIQAHTAAIRRLHGEFGREVSVADLKIAS
jgi:hypothetical protein